MQEVVLFPVTWHTFDKHKAKPIFLLSWSHPTQDEVNRGSAIHSVQLRSQLLQHRAHPQGALKALLPGFVSVVLLDIVWV